MPKKQRLKLVLANPRGFCAGVVRAVKIVERALEIHGPPVYVRHEIVHNKRVVDTLKAKGAVFVSEVDAIPRDAVTVFSAHGVSRKVEDDSVQRNLDVIDATCPLVTKVHNEGKRFAAKGYEIILIGHSGHPEIEGTMGQISGNVRLIENVEQARNLECDNEDMFYITQTTLSLDDTSEIIAELKRRFPRIKGPNLSDICYATQNRQNSVRALSGTVDALLVVGSKNSSNSNRLREIGEKNGLPSYLIQEASDINPFWLEGLTAVGITAGASAPEQLVEEVLDRLADLFETAVVHLDGQIENVHFRLPRKLESSAPRVTPGAFRPITHNKFAIAAKSQFRDLYRVGRARTVSAGLRVGKDSRYCWVDLNQRIPR